MGRESQVLTKVGHDEVSSVESLAFSSDQTYSVFEKLEKLLSLICVHVSFEIDAFGSKVQNDSV